jgi:hypothetical protein|mmetsp:Transcript_31929/g.47705  ORF Transcript_31929/g.47705 Transcript_31929/m.47705 type:complete len:80 (-) Transcript_31929:10-249(-)
MNRVLSGCCLVAIGITVDVGAFKKAVATEGPKLPTARRTPAEDRKRSIGVVETMDLPANGMSSVLLADGTEVMVSRIKP